MSAGETTPLDVENQQMNAPTSQTGNSKNDESSDTKNVAQEVGTSKTTNE